MLFVGIILGVVFIFLIILFRLSLFSKLFVTRGKFEGGKVVYRIVKGNFETLQREQSIYTRRAQSLWGKEMSAWPTFRITFPRNKMLSIFGICVPDSFDCDPDCLQELGFVPGNLDELPDAAKIMVPMRSCTAVKLNQMRARRSFKSFFDKNTEFDANSPLAEFRQKKKHKQTFVRPLGRTKILKGLWASAEQ
ncbi:hypothetical protein TRFO_26181 [Tritrichomonas foetus]|uniref:Uncharacterized protein n=1 Tax=Tritrichomonas foetus TaxID=1144522 RepID=A0A1J4K3Z5_9EUKA|nr:hypothetical protein TRFO_26181 [Tritrichomonas foetus]|eukprot:OHT05907.1 hypothetical protein TRFO_26181 [Tritrichomonas foetus]